MLLTLPLRGATVPLAALVGLRHHAGHVDIRERARRRGSALGARTSRFRGRGMDFEEVRVYQPGDDVRAIDWRVTARKGQPHTKVFREERERPLLLAVDARARMAFGSRVRFKYVAAAEVAALAAWAALARGDRVGGLVFGVRGTTALRPHRSEAGVLRLLAAIADSAPGGTDDAVDAAIAPPSLCDVLTRLATGAGHGLVVLVSDFHDLDASAVQACERLCRRAEVIGIHVHDALEAELPPPAQYTVSDGSQRRLLDSRDGAARRLHHERFAARIEALRALAARTGMRRLTLATDSDAHAALVRGGLLARAH
jgi:uncharacterized protein (DUF58 family)